MFCTNCGNKMPDGAAFCTQCGTKIKTKEAVQAAAPVQQQAAAPVQQQSAPVQQQAAAPVQQAAAPVQQAQNPYAPQPINTQVKSEASPSATSNVSPYASNAVDTNVNNAYTAPTVNSVSEYANKPSYANSPVQAANTATEGQPTKKKTPVGLIIGLAVGIPVLVIIIVAVVLVIVFKSAVESITGGNSVVTSEDDGDDDDKPTPAEPPVDPVEPSGDEAVRTIMIYMVGSDLECPEYDGVQGGAGTEDIYEMLAADIPEGVNVVLECGGAYRWEHPSVPDGVVSRHIISDNELELVENLGTMSMVEDGALTDFIEFASTNYPAENYSLIFWNHGGGIPIGYGKDQLGDEFDMMTDAEIEVEIEAAGVHFETVIFDACNMCSLEIGMALDGNADYMIGAESYVNGIGIYYTNWLAATDTSNPLDYSELIVDDYMDSLDEYNLVGSMSVIRLDKIQEVYNAYEDYLAETYTYVFEYGDYVNYYKARSNSGLYEGTDSVDIITLATLYPTNTATALINNVINSVVYTKSDIPYGHGLTAYSPYTYFHLYDEGRKSLTAFGYSDTILRFYDSFVSVILANYGDDVVAQYAGDWYVGDSTVTAVADTNTVQDTITLDTIRMENYYALDLTSDDWDIVYSVSSCYIIEFDYDDAESEYLMLGQDYQYITDSNDYIALVDPEYWFYINDNIASYFAIDYYDNYETGEWSQMGFIPVTVNGYEAGLYIYFDQDNPGGVVLGYSFFDYSTFEAVDNTMYMVEDNLKIDLYYPFMDSKGDLTFYESGESFMGSELKFELSYVNFDEYYTYGYLEIEDVYGQEYDTEIRPLGSNSAVN